MHTRIQESKQIIKFASKFVILDYRLFERIRCAKINFKSENFKRL